MSIEFTDREKERLVSSSIERVVKLTKDILDDAFYHGKVDNLHAQISIDDWEDCGPLVIKIWQHHTDEVRNAFLKAERERWDAERTNDC